MKIVYGGSFNPPTKAHLEVYKYLREKIIFREFIYLPVSSKYAKTGLESNKDRYKMLKIMTKGLKRVNVSKLEMNDKTYLGTYMALKRLGSNLFFVIGADNLLSLDKWKNSERLVSEYKFIVLGRNDIDISKTISDSELLSKYETNFVLFSDFCMDISASTYRETKDESLLCDGVVEYIKKHDLFKEAK